MNFSFFPSIKKPTTRTLTFSEYLKMVKNGMDSLYVDKINRMRSTYKKGTIRQYKALKESLPAVTVSSLVEGKRSDAAVTAHSGIIALDIDSSKNKQKYIDNFNDKSALAWHRSISGDGLVVYYRIPTDIKKHIDAFRYLTNKLKTEHNLIVDQAVQSVSSFRYISYDPDLVYNKKAGVIQVKPVQDEPDSIDIEQPDESDRDQLRDLVDEIEQNKVDLVDDRNDWVKMAAVFHRTFQGNQEGLELFDRISSFGKKYKGIKDCKKVYDSMKGKKVSQPASIGSLVYLMETSGLKPVTGGVIKQFKEKHDADWKDYMITDEPEDDVPIIKINGVESFTAGNHSLVIGKEKSRKSLLTAMLISWYENQNQIPKDVMIADTEQGKKHVWKARERIYKLTGKYPVVLSLRGEAPKKRLKILKEAVLDFNPKLLIIDGIRDLVYDINDPKECTEVITWVEKLTVINGVHIMNVLHLNKTDGNARGHMGTELMNKAETVLELTLDKEKNLTKVECRASRGVPFEPFAFSHNLKGLPQLCDMPLKAGQFTDDEIHKKLKTVFGKDQLKYADAVEEIKIHFGLGTVAAKKLVADLMFKKILVGIGKPRTADYKYQYNGNKSE